MIRTLLARAIDALATRLWDGRDGIDLDALDRPAPPDLSQPAQMSLDAAARYGTHTAVGGFIRPWLPQDTTDGAR